MPKSRTSFSCPVCQSGNYSILGPYVAKTESFKDRELVKCLKCSAVRMHPCFLECASEDYYSEQYWTDEKVVRRSPSLRVQAKARCNFMKPGISCDGRLRVLDVGAGIGYMNWGFREVWPNSQIEYTAIEVNPAAEKYLSTDPGVNYFASDINEIHGLFDVIVLSHILEHITEPVEFLLKIKNYLKKPGGCLFVETPNLDFRFKTRNEPHVLFYSPESLSAVLIGQGFKIIRVATCGRPIWKKRADGGMDSPSMLLNLRRILYKILVRSKAEFDRYGVDRQWLRVLCEIGDN